MLAVGWLLGGKVGVGTAIFALLVGPAVGYGLAIAAHLGRRPMTEVSERRDRSSGSS